MFLPILTSFLAAPSPAPFVDIPRLSLLPDLPAPFEMRDWRRVARGFDHVVFDGREAPGYGPLFWRDPTAQNLGGKPGFGMPSYVGHPKMTGGNTHEAICTLAALLSSTLVGRDRAELVPLAVQYYRPEDGVVLNRTDTKSGVTAWYEVLPSILFAQLADLHPKWTEGNAIARKQADRWAAGVESLRGDFDHTALDLRAMKPFDNGTWKEPDQAAGLAYLEYGAYARYGGKNRLDAAKSCLDALERRADNPTYEVLTSYGAVAAARMNAEQGTRYDVARLVDWGLEPSTTRTGWGMIAGRWSGYDVGGLVGSVDDGGGYAFGMNTFAMGANLAAVARYDDRFSGAVAKYLLNATNAARLLYGVGLPEDHKSFGARPWDPENSIPFEGLRRSWHGVSPRAMGDPVVQGWAKTDLCLYGGAWAGLFGALVRPTSDPTIPAFRLDAVDRFAKDPFPTELLRNPHTQPRVVTLDVGPAPVRLYDAVSNRVLASRAKKSYALRLAPGQTVQIVTLPVAGDIVRKDGVARLGGRVVDYDVDRDLPTRKPRKARDLSVTVSVPYATPTIDGDGGDWPPLDDSAGHIALDTGGRGKGAADLRFAWDDSFLYVLLRQTAPATVVREADDARLRNEPWTVEGTGLRLDLARGAFATTGPLQIWLGWRTGAPAARASAELDVARWRVASRGTAANADRTVEAAIPWADLAREATLGRRTAAQIAHPGARIGCQPLFVDGTYERQSYVGGAQFRAPSGDDANSRTLVLIRRK